jgi:transcription antitermination factor NusG
MIRVPLFPGYVFAKTDLNPNEHIEILKTIGAVRLIGNVAGPIPVPEQNIDSLKIMVAANDEILTGTRFKKGDHVMVVAGPFAGVVGTFSYFKGKERVVVEINALGQVAAVDVDIMDIEKLPDIKS